MDLLQRYYHGLTRLKALSTSPVLLDDVRGRSDGRAFVFDSHFGDRLLGFILSWLQGFHIRQSALCATTAMVRLEYHDSLL